MGALQWHLADSNHSLEAEAGLIISQQTHVNTAVVLMAPGLPETDPVVSQEAKILGLWPFWEVAWVKHSSTPLSPPLELTCLALAGQRPSSCPYPVQAGCYQAAGQKSQEDL